MDNGKPIITEKVDVHQLDAINILPGGMGLKGMWAMIGNSTAMTLLAIVLFMMISQVRAMHQEGIVTLKQILDIQLQQQHQVIKENTAAVRELIIEVKALRNERQKNGGE